MAAAPVLSLGQAGLYCAAGDFHIDPWRPTPRALITHAHSDHARPGQGVYLATPVTAALLRHRLGPVQVETIGLGVAGLSLAGVMVHGGIRSFLWLRRRNKPGSKSH